MRTPGFGLRRRSSTSGVLPIAWTMSPYFPPHGLLSRRGSSTSESVVVGSPGGADYRHPVSTVSSCEYGGAQQQRSLSGSLPVFQSLWRGGGGGAPPAPPAPPPP